MDKVDQNLVLLYRRLLEDGVSRRRLLQLTGGIATAAFLAACGVSTSPTPAAGGSGSPQPGGSGSPQPGGSGSPQPGGGTGLKPAVDSNTIVVADATTPPSLDYDQIYVAQSQEANDNLYANWVDYAVQSNPKGFGEPNPKQITPILAESTSDSADGLVHTVKLHQGLMSTAGNELTTDDIVWMFQRHFATKTSGQFQVGVGGISTIDQIKVLDRYTFEVHLPSYNSIFWDAMVPHLATNVWDSVEGKKHATTDDPFALKWLGVNSAGWGPYQLVNLSAGQSISYKANPNYVLGAPPTQNIEYKVVPESANRLALLRAGQIDVAKYLLPLELDQARKDPNLQVYDVPGNAWVRLYMNCGVDPFKNNPNVRRALCEAIPTQDIINTVYFGTAAPGTGPCSSFGPDWCQSCWEQNGPKFNLDDAKQLLAAGGYPNGFKSTLTYNLDETDVEQVAILIQSSWAKIGVQVDLNKVPAAAMNQGRNTHQFPMFLEEDYLIVNRAAYEIPLFFTPGSTINWSNYEADSYGDFAFWDKVQAAVAEKDPAKALSEWADIQTFMAKTAVIGSIVDPGFHVAVKKGLNGFTWNTDNQIRWQFFHWS